jgi:hypothetical protein
VSTDVSEEYIAPIFRVKKISSARHRHESRCVISQKMVLFNTETVDLGSLELNVECQKTINQGILNGGSYVFILLLTRD